MVGHNVFISYARRSAAQHAQNLHESLGAVSFFDRTHISHGAELPTTLLDSLLASKVVVIFADETYFSRQYCVQELTVALAPFHAVQWRSGSEADLRDALNPIVVALPVGGGRPEEMDRLPPLIRNSNLPQADDTESIVGLVSTRVASITRTIGERLDDLGALEAVRDEMRAVEVPYARNLAGTRTYPIELRASLERAFVDRTAELWALHDALSTARVDTTAAAVTGSLQGGGGFGKTRLAIEYVHRYGPQNYPGGLFWIDADVPPERLEEQFVGMLEVLTDRSIDIRQFRAAKRNARRELATAFHELAPEMPPLCVVDNVLEPGPTEPPKELKEWFPAIGKVALLATSRASQVFAGAVETVRLDVLPPGPSVSLLTRDYQDRSVLPQSGWEGVAEWVGRLPLALVLLNASLRGGALSATELVQISSQRRPAAELDRQMDALRGSVPQGALRGITEAFEASFDRLPPNAQAGACLLAQLSADAIPVVLLEAISQELSGAAVRTVLVSRSFVTPVPTVDLDVPMYGRMHGVLADYLRSRTTDETGDLRRICHTLIELQQHQGDPGSWPQLTACLPHAEQVFRRAGTAALSRQIDGRLAVLLGLFIASLLSRQGAYGRARLILESARDLATETVEQGDPVALLAASNLAEATRELGDFPEARRLNEGTLELCQRTLGDEHPLTLQSMNNLAGTLLDMGDAIGAQLLFERLLATRRQALGSDDPDTLATMTSLAMTLSAQGRFEQARRLQEVVLESERRVLGDEHENTLRSMNNLASLLDDFGDYARARDLVERVLKARQVTLGAEHPITLGSMHNLAHAMLRQGDTRGALDLYARVVEARRRILGDDHPDTLTSLHNLASILYDQGELEGAHGLQARVLDARRRILGDDHPDTLSTMGNLAETLEDQGDLEGAIEQNERVVEARQRIIGNDHPDTLRSMANLAAKLARRGAYERARMIEERIVDIRRRTLGDEHPDTVKSMNNLASTLYKQGHLEEARMLQERALDISRRRLGEEHPETLTSMSNLASMIGDQGNTAGARVLQERVLEARRRTLGEEHFDTLVSMSNLASTLRDEGELERVQDLHQHILQMRKRKLGEEHPDTLVSMNNLAEVMSARGDFAGARDLQERGLVMFQRKLGEDHPNTLRMMGNLALTLQRQGELARAQTLEERVLEISQRTLGEEHPDTLLSMSNLAMFLRAQGGLEQARSLQERALETCERTLGEEHPLTLTAMSSLARSLEAQNDLRGATRLRERRLAICTRLHGTGHPETISAAWDLFVSLANAGVDDAAKRASAHLTWLLDRDPTCLSLEQRDQRSQLKGWLRARPG
jgi:tetratricopeptide (TPR) repeat protein